MNESNVWYTDIKEYLNKTSQKDLLLTYSSTFEQETAYINSDQKGIWISHKDQPDAKPEYVDKKEIDHLPQLFKENSMYDSILTAGFKRLQM